MKVDFGMQGSILSIETENFKVPFTKKYGFFVGDDDIALKGNDNVYTGDYKNIAFLLRYDVKETHLEINIEIKNNGTEVITEDIGFHMGIDSYMESYPQWHKPFFPTLLRCEKTHMWGYYMNTEENALALATAAGVSSYDINYNMINEEHCGHRICGTDILFIKNAKLPGRHPENLNCLKAGTVYKNTIYFIPVENKINIVPKISEIANVPMIQSLKYTYEKGDKFVCEVYSGCGYKAEFILPDGSVKACKDFVFEDFGIYKLKVCADNGKISEALFCCRKDWDFYLYNASKEALNKPPKATTHVESLYGLFSMFLSMKYFDDEYINKKSYECFDEIMPLIFNFSDCTPIVIPDRIQNTALLISLLTDMYEVDPEKNLKYLKYASNFGDWLMGIQDDTGAYRSKDTHYTCVIYVAKAMLELANAEKNCEDTVIKEKYSVHYESVRKAVDELVLHLDNIDTEGELTLEDGMISCSALQIAMFALTLPEEKREKYTKAAEYMLKIHSCLEQQLIPDCRMNGCSLRYWESQYDVMIKTNMLNSPHGWTGWTAYAQYYLYMLTGEKDYLVRLMNTLGSCAQLMSFEGKLRWGFCAQPYVKAKGLVPDTQKEVKDGYSFVDTKVKAYKGKYEIREFGETYIDMISGWYRAGEQKVMGGFKGCPLFLKDDIILQVDDQGGCCDNDVHEIFKCIEECVLRKAFIYENEDGSLLTYGCKAKIQNGNLDIVPNDTVREIIYNVRKTYNNTVNNEVIKGFGIIK